MPTISYFEIEPTVFDSNFNFKYTNDLPTEDTREVYRIIYQSDGVRHGLKIINKFSDGNMWLENDNVKGDGLLPFMVQM